MKRMLTALTAGTLLLAACSSGSDDTAQTSEANTPATSTQASETTPTGPPRSARNNLVKNVGEVGGMGCQTGPNDCQLTFTVESLAVDPACSTPEYTAVAVDVSLQTTSEFNPNFVSGVFQDDEWSIIGDDGVTRAGEEVFATPCSSDPRLPNTLAPASKYERRILLQSSTSAGILQYVPRAYDGYSNTNGGWEWTF